MTSPNPAGERKISDDDVVWIRRVGYPQLVKGNITQIWLAKRFKVSPQYINDIIRGKRRKYGKVELK